MKKHLLTLSVVLAGAVSLSVSALAQDEKPAGGGGGRGGPGGPGGRPMMSSEERLKHMKETLSLTDDQVAKIKPILDKASEAGKAVHDDANLKPEEKRAKMQESMKSTRDEIDAILTPEQKEKQKAEMEKRREGRGGRGPGGGGGAAK